MRILLRILFGVLALAIVGEAALAAMTIDFGTKFIKIGIVKPGIPMDIALNPESRRKTPNMVLIQNDGQRSFGDAAVGLQIRFPHLAIENLNDLFGKTIDHPSVEVFRQRNPFFELSKTPRNESAIALKIGDETYSIESLAAMILANAKKFTEEYGQINEIKDVVITVPVYFTPIERLSVERAAQMAGFNVLQLINDGTAAALSHGIFRRKEITEKVQRLMIYDMGAGKTTVTIVEYQLIKGKYEKEPKMKTIGIGYDRTLGGIEMTNRLKDYLIDEFEKVYKPKTAVRTNRRAYAKFAKEAERLKQVLSANVEHFAQIESAHEEIDARLKVTREIFNGLINDLETRIGEPIEQALRMAQIPIEEIDQFVLMGAGTRVPKVQEIIQKTIGEKQIGRFLNTDEAIAMGALYQAAHLCQGFKVKTFHVADKLLFPVEVHFLSKIRDEKNETNLIEKNVQKTLFAANSEYPTSTKTISLTSYRDDFTIQLKFGTIELLTKKQLNEIGGLLDELVHVRVIGLGEALANRTMEETDFKGVKMSFQIDASGIVRIKKAEATIETKSGGIVDSITSTLSGLFSSKSPEEGEPEEASATSSEFTGDDVSSKEEPSPTTEKTTTKEKEKAEAENEKAVNETTTTTETNEEIKPEGNATVGNKNESAVVTEEKIEKPLPKVVKLKLERIYPSGFVPNRWDVKNAKEILDKFAEAEQLAVERAAAENELEAFNYESSQLLDDQDFVEYASEDEKTKLSTETSRIRGWLEDEVTKETLTKNFVDNLLVLKNLVRNVKKRREASKAMPEKLKTLSTLVSTSMSLASMGENVDETKALFDRKDSEAFKKKLDKVKIWVEENQKIVETTKKFEDLEISVREVETKISNLNREVDRFMKKMKKVTTLDELTKDEEKTEKKEKKEKKEAKEAKEAKEEEKKTTKEEL